MYLKELDYKMDRIRKIFLAQDIVLIQMIQEVCVKLIYTEIPKKGKKEPDLL